ncbi:unnamed protein product [Mytilus coruscus]|uniref:Uncharacterized protein n=1 Tax=Mytilus coruscus TaxID=42192 RepID=A0A6J8E2F4_MYTCO|nr:unnamed protein product [Mytilus coruscus]
MDEMCGGNAFSQMYMKKRLKQHFRDEIIITDIPGKNDVVTLRETVTCILQDYYQRPSNLNLDDEKRALIKATAKFIKRDIRSVKATKCIYPTPANIVSVDTNLSYLPESLLCTIFSEKDLSVKIASIGQAVMKASRPLITSTYNTASTRSTSTSASQLRFSVSGVHIEQLRILFRIL